MKKLQELSFADDCRAIKLGRNPYSYTMIYHWLRWF